MAFEPPTEYNSAIMVNKSFQIVSPTVAELTAANPILAYNSNLAQTAATTATTQAQKAATSAQAAQTAAAQATEISDPEGWRTATRDLITELNGDKVNVGTFNFYPNGGCLQTTDNPMYGIVDRSYCMTLELKEDWNLAETSELWLNLASDGIRASSLNYGGVWCQFYRTGGINYLMIVYGDGQTQTLQAFGNKIAVENIFGGTNNSIIPAGKYVISLCLHFGNATSANWSNAYVYVNGVLKATMSGYSTTKVSNLGWVSGGKLGFFDLGNSHITSSFSRFGHFNGNASRFSVFNFNMSAADALYTVADYYNGKAIPPSLYSFQNTTWNATSVPVYNTIANSFTDVPLGSVGFMNQSASIAYEDDGSISWTASSSTSGFPSAFVYRFKKTAIGRGKITVNLGALTSTLPSDTKFFVNYFNSLGIVSDSTRKQVSESGGSFEFNYEAGCAGVDIQIGTDTTWAIGNSLKIASVSLSVDGCVLALADYSMARNVSQRRIKDTTGNGNDMIIFGEVVGDKDAGVDAFIDELKTQITQNG